MSPLRRSAYTETTSLLQREMLPMSQMVESRMGAVAWGPMAIAPFPIPARQTGRADFRHPAFRLASPQGTRRANEPHAASAR